MKDSKVEFQPAANLSPLAERHLRQLTSASSLRQMFADGAETYYDEYAQAWRALGFYTDCDYVMDNNQGGNVGGCQRFLLWAAVSTRSVCFAFPTYSVSAANPPILASHNADDIALS